ncbi:tyrosine-protein kinase domain-containing protein [Urechidicola sp. KH5]
MSNEFDFLKPGKEDITDLKDFLFRVISHWKWFLVTIPIGLGMAYYLNISSEKAYGLHATISVKEQQNPLFATGTNIAFNWGGVSDKVESLRRVISSRSHNEQVVRELEFYVEYLQEGRFRVEDVYGKTPFNVVLEPNGFQLLNTLIYISFIDNERFKLTVDFGESKEARMINYNSDEQHIYPITQSVFKSEFSLNEPLTLPFMRCALQSIPGRGNLAGKEYMIRFKPVNAVVGKYQAVRAEPIRNTSLLSVTLTGPNKNRLVDYLNETVELLAEKQLNDKTNYARQTLKFIEEQFKNTQDSLRLIEVDMGVYKEEQDIYNLSAEGSNIFSNTLDIDEAQLTLNERLEYYENLINYINNHQSFTSIPAPAVIGVEDGSIAGEVQVLTSLSLKKLKLASEVTENHPSLVSLNQEIEAAKIVLLENIASVKKILEVDIKNSQKRLNIYNTKLQELPEKEQQLLNFQRKYAMTESNYKYLLQKRYEADIAIAASVSDITILDRAKDMGQASMLPRTGFNYMVGFMLSIILPLFIIVIKEVFDTKIQTVESIERLTSIPVLGVVGRKVIESNLAVFEKPKSSVAEAFRALRSNIHFLFSRNTNLNKSKTVVFTSSVSGEGKTFCSINMATVFALSGKKTVLVGLDLRKPKIFGEFNLDSNLGVVNYLIGQSSLKEVIQKTQIENLDLIISGPIPPNPSELLISDASASMIKQLQEDYEYVILDTPPIGLVTDAFDIIKFADVTLYVIRQGFTQKGMIKMVNRKYEMNEMKNISIVLNNFKVKSKYDMGYGYGNGYGQGYHDNGKRSLFQRIFNR